jgi:nucleoside-diphosphate-sugar epimerase
MRVLVTGATGFVGSAVVRRLATVERYDVRAASRVSATGGEPIEHVSVGDIGLGTDWTRPVAGVDAVVHAAARAHRLSDAEAGARAVIRAVNVDATLRLARQAADAGVRRFVFISSIKVNGESTTPNRPFTADDAPAPVEAYGASKLAAELGLSQVARETGMEVVIIRPVLVYGPGVKANFRAMMSWVNRGIPLPFGNTGNLRSLVAVENLVDLVTRVLTHPAAANRTFLVSDGEDISTTELLRRTAKALDRPSRLISVPAALLQAAAWTLGKGAVASRLLGSLQVDIRETCDLLGWSPPVRLDDALADTARDFLEHAG